MALLSRHILSKRTLLLCGVIALGASPTHAQPAASEYQVKAAFLFNFARFVEFPDAAADERFSICIHGSDPFGWVLDRAIEGKTVRGAMLQIHRTEEESDLADCDLVFLSADDEARIESTLHALDGRAVLTVGESEEFLESGGTIRLLLVQNKVRFEINVNAAREAGLKISSQLLKLATRVVGAKE